MVRFVEVAIGVMPGDEDAAIGPLALGHGAILHDRGHPVPLKPITPGSALVWQTAHVDESRRIETKQFSRILAEGAEASGALEVRLVKIPRTDRESWPKRRMTLYNQIDTDGVGAYAHVLQTNGSRWVYTTSRGRAQEATLQRWTSTPVATITAGTFDVLVELLEASILEAMRLATHDSRSRRAAARGFDVEDAITYRDREARFFEIAVGREPITLGDMPEYLLWWDQQVGRELQLQHRGLPVPRDVLEAARKSGASDLRPLLIEVLVKGGLGGTG